MIRYDAHIAVLFLMKDCNINTVTEMMKMKNGIDCYIGKVYSSSCQYNKLIKR